MSGWVATKTLRCAAYSLTSADLVATYAWANGRLTQSRINGGIFDQTYTYATAQDDGRLVSQTDAISGETVAYQYDTLGRLTRAETTGPQWGLAWTYDGFGNRLTQSVVKGSGPTASTPVYPATNRLQDASIDYDAAGNVTRFSMPDSSQRWLTWDALNRMTAAWTGSPYPDGHTEVYTYDAGNQRVMKQHDQDQPVFTFYGIDGKPMGDYTVNWDTTQVWFTGGGWSASVGFFGLENPNRLQSRGNHYPYGEQKGAYTPSFATYTRESFTNLDYAINRYYSAPTGRFISPDPYQASGGAADPGSWNRYGYVEGDPVNFNDSTGLQRRQPWIIIDYWVGREFFTAMFPNWDYEPEEYNAEVQSPAQKEFDVRSLLPGMLDRAINGALDVLRLASPDCLKLFDRAGKGLNPGDLLSKLRAGNTLYGEIVYGKVGDSSIAETQPLIPEPGSPVRLGAQIIVSNKVPSAWFFSEDKDRVGTILHELAHAFDLIWGVGTSDLEDEQSLDSTEATAISNRNSNTVRTRCLK